MKKILLIVFLGLIALTAYNQTNVTANITANTTWTKANSPYILTKDIFISQNITLTVQPGVEITGNSYTISVYGKISAVGSLAEPILINQLKIMTGSNASAPYYELEFRFCKFQGGVPYGAGAQMQGTLNYTDSEFRNTDYWYLWYPLGNSSILRNIFYEAGGISVGIYNGTIVTIENNLFINPTTQFAIADWNCGSPSQLNVHYNSFINTDRVALMLPGGYTGGNMNATNNFWNTTSTDIIDAMIWDKNDDPSAGAVIPYLPILSEPDPGTPIKAMFTQDVSEGLAPLTVGFTSQSAGNLTDWEWDFGDGVTASGQNAGIHTYSTPGVYSVKLTVSNATQSNSEVKTGLIIVHEVPVASFVASKRKVCTFEQVTFQNTSTGYYTQVFWYVNGQPYPQLSLNGEFKANVPGAYDIKLVVKNPFLPGGAGIEIPDYIVASDVPDYNTNIPDSIYGTDPITVNYLGNAPTDADYYWNFDGAIINSGSGQGPYEISYSDLGLKHLELFIDNNGCPAPDTAKWTVGVNPRPVASFTSTKTKLCVGETINLTNTSTGYITNYTWTINGETSHGKNATFTSPVAGNFDVQLNISNNYANSSDEKLLEDYFTVSTIPTYSTNIPTLECGNDPITINYLGNAPADAIYTWDFDDATINSGSGQGPYEIKFNAFGNKNLKLFIDNNGCTAPDTGTFSLDVNPVPQAAFEAEDAICFTDPLTVTYSGTASNEAELFWDLDGGISGTGYPGGTFDVNYSSGGLKTIDLSISDKGCISQTVSKEINVAYPYSNLSICIVTIDQETGKNMVVWQRPDDPAIQAYNVYSETTVAGQYDLLGTVNSPENGVFVDLTSLPEQQMYRYKISVVDTCGNESVKSDFHEPLFLQYTGSVNGVNLQWKKYAIEDQTLNFASYIIYRGSDSTALTEVATVSGNFNLYTDNSPDALSGRQYYRVAGVMLESCDPVKLVPGKKASSGPFVHSLSNLEDNRLQSTNGISMPAIAKLNVFPNPMSNETTIRFDNPKSNKYDLIIYDMRGCQVRVYSNICSDQFLLKKDNLKSGYYLLELKGDNTFRGRLMVE